MILYLIKSGICLTLVLCVHHLILEREKMHHFNRFFLLFGVLFSLAVPLITTGYGTELISETYFIENIVGLDSVELNKGDVRITPVSNFNRIFPAIYWIVVMVLLMRLVYRLGSLTNRIIQSEKINYQGIKLILRNENVLPHTFLNYIFINKTLYEKGEIEEELLAHELAHARQGHSLDVLLIESLKILFWFNPILFFYKRAIQLNHEFLADDAVIKNHKHIPDYQYLLLDKASTNEKIYLASNLNFLLTKKRLKMMTKNTSRIRVYTLATMTIPLFITLLMLFGNSVNAQKKSTNKSDTELQKQKDEFFKNATFVCEEDKNKKIYKAYKDLTDEEKAAIPLPPPPPPVPLPSGKKDRLVKHEALPAGTLVYFDVKGDRKIRIDLGGNVPPPPPPPPVPAPPKAPKGIKPPPPPPPPLAPIAPGSEK